jgi:hypothetical protein
MVVTDLKPEMVQAGENLLRELDAEQADVDSAFWYLFPDEGYWKLLVSFRDVEKEGPRVKYERIQKALSRIQQQGAPGPALADIGITKPQSPLVTLLKGAVRTGPGISGIRFSNNVINGQLIRDAHIYRLT